MEEPGENPKPKNDIYGRHVLTTGYRVKNSHTFYQWKTIWTMYLEKEMAIPIAHNAAHST